MTDTNLTFRLELCNSAINSISDFGFTLIELSDALPLDCGFRSIINTLSRDLDNRVTTLLEAYEPFRDHMDGVRPEKLSEDDFRLLEAISAFGMVNDNKSEH